MQKNPDETIICTKDYVPTFTDLRFKPEATSTTYDFMPYRDNEQLKDADLFNQKNEYCLADPDW